MTMGNVIRLMEERDLFDVPDAREEFKEHGTHGDYFFFVIVKPNRDEDTDEKIVGYLMAKKEGEKLIVKKISLDESIKEKSNLYKNTAFSNLYEYASKIRGKNKERFIYQISLGI